MSQLWSEAKTSEGRFYYYNTQTKETQWTKPEALMTATERALASQPWKEYQDQSGRKYWYNAETKISSWEMPDVYKHALSQSSSIPPKPPVSSQIFVAGGAPNIQHPYSQARERDDQGYNDRNDRGDRFDRGDRDRTNYGQSDNPRSNFVPATITNEPDYATYEEAEAAFLKLLKRCNVQPEWTWEETMRNVIKDSQYRSLKDPKDRKATFEKYVVETRIQDKERVKERMAKLREDFGTMLKSHPEIKHYTRWKTARPIIEGETIFRSAGDDTERRQLFEEYVAELRKTHLDNERIARGAALGELVVIFKGLVVEPYTRWSEAQGMIDSDERIQSDAKFQTLTKADVLNAFDNHIKSLERTMNEKLQLEKSQKSRHERQNRDAFVSLLQGLRSDGKIKAGTKWMDVCPNIAEDTRYLALLGQSGSTPLDLFWDMVEEAERILRAKRNDVLDVLDDQRFEITIKTSPEEFINVMDSDLRTKNIDPDDLHLIFGRLHEKVVRRSEEDKHQAERAQRRAIDALRSRIKHLEPPVRTHETWETDVRPRVEKYEEYRAIDSEDLRRSAFDKVMRRLKEKEVDMEHVEKSRRSDRVERESRSNGHRRERDGRTRYSRTPEADAYEADRRKAIADRERQHHRTSGAGQSPQPADAPRRRDARNSRYDERERYDDRERYEERERNDNRERYDERERHDRLSRPAGTSVYDRERRERELERERSYVSRADPREAASKELDYGESGRTGSMSNSGSVAANRRRRSDMSEEGERRETKRNKRNGGSATPADTAGVEKEEEALKSGSEEGEIEEV